MKLINADRKIQRQSPTKEPQGINQWEDGRLPPEVRCMIDWVIEAVDGKHLTLGQKAVLRKMLWLDREVDMGCYASAEYIGGLWGMASRAVRRHRTALVKKGYSARNAIRGL